MTQRIAKKVLLIGWDGADWEHINPLLEQGLMPGLEALINRGVMGNLATLNPILSPMLWNSIATGKTADKHGVYGFTQPLANGKGVRPYASTSRKVKALWNICHQNDMRSNVVGWWASHPAEPINGCVVTNLFNGLKRDKEGKLNITPGTFHPVAKSEELANLKVHHAEIGGEDILPFIPLAEKIDQSKDPRLSTACKLLSDCASIHSVTTHLVENETWDLTAVYFDSIDHFCHAFMYYHPPQMPNVKDEDFEIFKDVIVGAYRFHDMALQRLLHLAGEDTTVVLCSDHGFQSGHLRPLATPAEPAGPAAWHRNLGIVVMAGPGIKKDERIYGANIIDITPTILYQLGLPVGEDMDGRVLIDAFENPETPATIPSWEDVEGPCGMHPPEFSDGSENMGGEQSKDLVKQFVALGYIEDPGDDLEKAARNCQLELDYNLARVYQSTNRYEKALEMFTDLVRKMPWEDRYWSNLANCCFELGYFRQAKTIMQSLYRDIKKPTVFTCVFLAKTCFELGELDETNEYLDRALALEPRQPMVYVIAGRLRIKNRELEKAERMFKKGLEADPDCAHAWLGLARTYLRQQRFEEAADAALSAVVIQYRLEKGHWVLGVALRQLGQFDQAAQAFKTLLKFKSTIYSVAAHRQLMRINKSLGLHSKASEHAQSAREALKERRRQKKESLSRHEKMLDLPEVPTSKERLVTHREERPRKQGRKQQKAPGSSGRTLNIVSGLPRSGTSLMMQMLAAGGLVAKTDGQREADVDNPQGYLEWEEVKKLPKSPQLFDDETLDSQVIKVISMLVTALPVQHRYRVIFMRRPVSEIASSQVKMIERAGNQGAQGTIEEIAEQLEQHRETTLKWLESRKFIDLLIVDYPKLISNPTEETDRVAKFFGAEILPQPQLMASAINPSLYRQKMTVENKS